MNFKKFAFSVVGLTDVMPVKDMVESINDTGDHLEELYNGVESMVAHVNDSSENKQYESISGLLTRLGIKGKDVSSKLTSTNEVINKSRALLLEMRDILVETVGEDGNITFNSMSYRVSATVSNSERIMAYTSALSDIIIVISYMLNNDDLRYKQKMNETLRTASSISVTTYFLLKLDVPSHAKEVRTMSNEPIEDSEPTRTDSKFEPVSSSEFLYNPIYHARKWWTDIRFVFHERREIEANLLRLKIAELRAMDSDIDISDSIKYYEDKLDRVEVKIKDFEEE